VLILKAVRAFSLVTEKKNNNQQATNKNKERKRNKRTKQQQDSFKVERCWSTKCALFSFIPFHHLKLSSTPPPSSPPA